MTTDPEEWELPPPTRLDLLSRYHFDLSTCVSYCRALIEHVEQEGEDKMDARYLALAEASILSYARPFTSSETLAGDVHRLAGKSFRFAIPEWNEAHGWWMKLRHKAVAHSDEFFTQVRAVPRAPAGSYNSYRATITPSMVRLIQRMAEDLCERLLLEIHAEHTKQHGEPPKGPRRYSAGHGYFEEPDWVATLED